MKGVFWIPFPKPKRNFERWIRASGRELFFYFVKKKTIYFSEMEIGTFSFNDRITTTFCHTWNGVYVAGIGSGCWSVGPCPPTKCLTLPSYKMLGTNIRPNKNQYCNLFFFVREYEFLYINKLFYGLCGNSSQMFNKLSEVRITVSQDVWSSREIAITAICNILNLAKGLWNNMSFDVYILTCLAISMARRLTQSLVSSWKENISGNENRISYEKE
jgi:hypothetical protein